MKENNQDDPIIVGDNIEVIRILTDRGVLHMLDFRPEDTDTVKFYHFTEDDYWCQASHHTGHVEDKDNGYMLIKIPKTTMTKEAAAEFFLEMMVENREPGYDYTSVTFKAIPPLKHN